MPNLHYSAEEIDALLDKINAYKEPSHRNLLDNPFFTVNQRGFTSAPMSPAIYTVDRWKTYGYTSSTISVNADGTIKISTVANQGSGLRQIFEKSIVGTYTLSVNLKSGTPNESGNYAYLYYRRGTASVANKSVGALGISSFTVTLTESDACDGISINCAAGAEIDIVSVKLELGDKSTLKDDVAPNYAEELLKCQRYLYAVKTPASGAFAIAAGFAFSATNARFSIPTPAEMRANPTVDRTGLGGFQIIDGNKSAHEITTVGAEKGVSTLNLTITSTGLTAFDTLILRMNGTAGSTNGVLLFSAEL